MENNYLTEVRQSLMKILFENKGESYWISRGTTHQYGFNDGSGFVSLGNVVFNDSSNEFDAYVEDSGKETYLGSSGDLTTARTMVKAHTDQSKEDDPLESDLERFEAYLKGKGIDLGKYDIDEEMIRDIAHDLIRAGAHDLDHVQFFKMILRKLRSPEYASHIQ